jgi:hypothetical protein
MFSPGVLFVISLVAVIAACGAMRVFRPRLHATYTPYRDRTGHELPASAGWPREPLPDDPALTYNGDPDLQTVDFDEPAPTRRGGRARYVVAVIVVLWYAAVLIGHAHITAPWWVPVTVAAWNGIAIAARRRRAAA